MHARTHTKTSLPWTRQNSFYTCQLKGEDTASEHAQSFLTVASWALWVFDRASRKDSTLGREERKPSIWILSSKGNAARRLEQKAEDVTFGHPPLPGAPVWAPTCFNAKRKEVHISEEWVTAASVWKLPFSTHFCFFSVLLPAWEFWISILKSNCRGCSRRRNDSVAQA